jgi:hypothetical protein
VEKGVGAHVEVADDERPGDRQGDHVANRALRGGTACGGVGAGQVGGADPERAGRGSGSDEE